MNGKTIVPPLPPKSQSAAHLGSHWSTCTFSEGTLCIHNMNHHGICYVSTLFWSKVTKTIEAVIFWTWLVIGFTSWWPLRLKLSTCLNLLNFVRMSAKMVDKWWDFPPEGLCSNLKKCIILLSKRVDSFKLHANNVLFTHASHQDNLYDNAILLKQQ